MFSPTSMVLSSVMSRVLQDYVKPECFSADKVKADVFNSHITLEALELKRDVFSNLDMPIKMHRGVIDGLELEWSPTGLFKGDSIRITIRKLSLTFLPTSIAVDNDALLKRAERTIRTENMRKRLLLGRYEQLKSEARRTSERTTDSGTNASSSKVGVRKSFYERLTNQLFSGTDHMDKMFRGSSEQKQEGNDMEYNEIKNEKNDKLGDEKGIVQKEVQLRGLSVYWDPLGERETNHHYILKPFDADVRVRICNDALSRLRQIPTTTVDFRVKSFALVAEDDQLKGLIWLSSSFARSKLQVQYTRLAVGYRERKKQEAHNERMRMIHKKSKKDNESIGNISGSHTMVTAATIARSLHPYNLMRPDRSPREEPQRWWKYAVAAICQERYESRYHRSLAYITERRKQRIKYMNFWQRKKSGVKNVVHVTRSRREELVRCREEKKMLKQDSDSDNEAIEMKLGNSETTINTFHDKKKIKKVNEENSKKEEIAVRKINILGPIINDTEKEDTVWKCKVCSQKNFSNQILSHSNFGSRDTASKATDAPLEVCRTCGRQKGFIPNIFSLWRDSFDVMSEDATVNNIRSDEDEKEVRDLYKSNKRQINWLAVGENLAELSPIEVKELEYLEDLLRYEDIVFFRLLGERELRLHEELCRKSGKASKGVTSLKGEKQNYDSNLNFQANGNVGSLADWGRYLWSVVTPWSSNDTIGENEQNRHMSRKSSFFLPDIAESDVQDFFKELSDAAAECDPSFFPSRGYEKQTTEANNMKGNVSTPGNNMKSNVSTTGKKKGLQRGVIHLHTHIFFSLSEASVSLASNRITRVSSLKTQSSGGIPIPFVEAELRSFKIDLRQSFGARGTDAFRLAASLDDITIYDRCATSNARFHKLICRRKSGKHLCANNGRKTSDNVKWHKRWNKTEEVTIEMKRKTSPPRDQGELSPKIQDRERWSDSDADGFYDARSGSASAAEDNEQQGGDDFLLMDRKIMTLDERIDLFEGDVGPKIKSSTTDCGKSPSDNDQVLLVVVEFSPGNLAVSLHLDELDFICLPACFRHLKRFFQELEPHTIASSDDAAVRALFLEVEMLAMNKLADIGARTRRKLEYAMVHHTSLQLDVHVSAPVLFILEDGETDRKDAILLLIDLGHLSLVSVDDDERSKNNVVSKKQYQNFSSKWKKERNPKSFSSSVFSSQWDNNKLRLSKEAEERRALVEALTSNSVDEVSEQLRLQEEDDAEHFVDERGQLDVEGSIYSTGEMSLSGISAAGMRTLSLGFHKRKALTRRGGLDVRPRNVVVNPALLQEGKFSAEDTVDALHPSTANANGEQISMDTRDEGISLENSNAEITGVTKPSKDLELGSMQRSRLFDHFLLRLSRINIVLGDVSQIAKMRDSDVEVEKRKSANILTNTIDELSEETSSPRPNEKTPPKKVGIGSILGDDISSPTTRIRLMSPTPPPLPCDCEINDTTPFNSSNIILNREREEPGNSSIEGTKLNETNDVDRDPPLNGSFFLGRATPVPDMQPYHSVADDLHLLRPVDIGIKILTSRLPADPTLTRVRVSGELPGLHFHISATQYRKLLTLATSLAKEADDNISIKVELQNRIARRGNEQFGTSNKGGTGDFEDYDGAIIESAEDVQSMAESWIVLDDPEMNFDEPEDGQSSRMSKSIMPSLESKEYNDIPNMSAHPHIDVFQSPKNRDTEGNNGSTDRFSARDIASVFEVEQEIRDFEMADDSSNDNFSDFGSCYSQVEDLTVEIRERIADLVEAEQSLVASALACTNIQEREKLLVMKTNVKEHLRRLRAEYLSMRRHSLGFSNSVSGCILESDSGQPDAHISGQSTSHQTKSFADDDGYVSALSGDISCGNDSNLSVNDELKITTAMAIARRNSLSAAETAAAAAATMRDTKCVPRRLLEYSFLCGSINLTIIDDRDRENDRSKFKDISKYRQTRDGDRIFFQQEVVSLQLEEFALGGLLRSCDSDLRMNLRNIELRDKLQKLGPEFEYMVLSRRDGSLVSVSISTKRDDAPDYSKVKKIVDVSFDELQVTIHQPTIVALTSIFLEPLAYQTSSPICKEETLRDKDNKSSYSTGENPSGDQFGKEKSANLDEEKAKVYQDIFTVDLRVVARLQSVGICLVDSVNGIWLSRTQLMSSEINFDVYDDKRVEANGFIGNLTISDLRNGGLGIDGIGVGFGRLGGLAFNSAGIGGEQVFGLRADCRKSLVKWSFSSASPNLEQKLYKQEENENASKLVIDVQSVKCEIQTQFVNEISNFFFEGELAAEMPTILEKLLKRLSLKDEGKIRRISTRNNVPFVWIVKIDQPLFIIPHGSSVGYHNFIYEKKPHSTPASGFGSDNRTSRYTEDIPVSLIVDLGKISVHGSNCIDGSKLLVDFKSANIRVRKGDEEETEGFKVIEDFDLHCEAKFEEALSSNEYNVKLKKKLYEVSVGEICCRLTKEHWRLLKNVWGSNLSQIGRLQDHQAKTRRYKKNMQENNVAHNYDASDIVDIRNSSEMINEISNEEEFYVASTTDDYTSDNCVLAMSDVETRYQASIGIVTVELLTHSISTQQFLHSDPVRLTSSYKQKQNRDTMDISRRSSSSPRENSFVSQNASLNNGINQSSSAFKLLPLSVNVSMELEKNNDGFGVFDETHSLSVGRSKSATPMLSRSEMEEEPFETIVLFCAKRFCLDVLHRENIQDRDATTLVLPNILFSENEMREDGNPMNERLHKRNFLLGITSASVSLGSIWLEDKRPSRLDTFANLISPQGDKERGMNPTSLSAKVVQSSIDESRQKNIGKNENSMIFSVKFKREEDGTRNCNIHSYCPRFIIHPDALLSISNFFDVRSNVDYRHGSQDRNCEYKERRRISIREATQKFKAGEGFDLNQLKVPSSAVNNTSHELESSIFDNTGNVVEGNSRSNVFNDSKSPIVVGRSLRHFLFSVNYHMEGLEVWVVESSLGLDGGRSVSLKSPSGKSVSSDYQSNSSKLHLGSDNIQSGLLHSNTKSTNSPALVFRLVAAKGEIGNIVGDFSKNEERNSSYFTEWDSRRLPFPPAPPPFGTLELDKVEVLLCRSAINFGLGTPSLTIIKPFSADLSVQFQNQICKADSGVKEKNSALRMHRRGGSDSETEEKALGNKRESKGIAAKPSSLRLKCLSFGIPVDLIANIYNVQISVSILECMTAVDVLSSLQSFLRKKSPPHRLRNSARTPRTNTYGKGDHFNFNPIHRSYDDEEEESTFSRFHKSRDENFLPEESYESNLDEIENSENDNTSRSRDGNDLGKANAYRSKTLENSSNIGRLHITRGLVKRSVMIDKCNLNFRGMHVVLIDDTRGGNSNIAVAEMQLTSGDLALQVRKNFMNAYFQIVDVAANYHNRDLVAWEPLVEPWSCSVKMTIPRISNGLSPEFTNVMSSEFSSVTSEMESESKMSNSISSARGFTGPVKKGRGSGKSEPSRSEEVLHQTVDNYEEDSDFDKVLPGFAHTMTVSVIAERVLNLNITEHFLSSAHIVLRNIDTTLAKHRRLRAQNQNRRARTGLLTRIRSVPDPESVQSTRSTFSLYEIRNDCGVPLRYRAEVVAAFGNVPPIDSENNTNLNNDSGDELLMLMPDEQVPLKLPVASRGGKWKEDGVGRSSYTGGYESVSVTLCLELPEGPDVLPLTRVSAEQLGASLHTLKARNKFSLPLASAIMPPVSAPIQERPAAAVVCEVVRNERGGLKLLRVSSTAVFCNQTMLTLLVRLIPMESKSFNFDQGQEYTVKGKSSFSTFQTLLAPGGTCSIPVHIAHLGGALEVRPLLRTEEIDIAMFCDEIKKNASENKVAKTAGNVFFPIEKTGSGEFENTQQEFCKRNKESFYFCTKSMYLPRAFLPGEDDEPLREVLSFERQTISKAMVGQDESDAGMEAQKKTEDMSERCNLDAFSCYVHVHCESDASGRSRHIRSISFHPPIILKNCLSCAFEYVLHGDENNGPESDIGEANYSGGVVIAGGDIVFQNTLLDGPIYLSVRLPGFSWSERGIRIVMPGLRGIVERGEGTVSEEVVLFDELGLALTVCADITILLGGTTTVSLYVPFWVANRTEHHVLLRHAPEAHRQRFTLRFMNDEDGGGSLNKRKDETANLAAGQAKTIRLLYRKMHNRGLGTQSTNAELAKVLSAATSSSDVGYNPNRGDFRYDHSHSAIEFDRNRGDRHHLFNEKPPPLGLLDLLPKSKISRAPLLLGYTDIKHQRGSARLRVGTSNWSSVFALDKPAATTVVEVKQREQSGDDRIVVLGISVAVAPGRFYRTKKVIISPRFIIVNQLGRAVLCKQKGSPDRTSIIVPANGRAPFHWTSKQGLRRHVAFQLDEFGWEWSGGLSIDDVADSSLRLRNTHTHAAYVVRVETVIAEPTMVVIVRPPAASGPPYRIENLSLDTLRFSQKGIGRKEVLLPYNVIPYAFDEPTETKLLVVEAMYLGVDSQEDDDISLIIGEFSLDLIQKHARVIKHRLADHGLVVTISAEGPTRVIRFSDDRVFFADGLGLQSEDDRLLGKIKQRNRDTEKMSDEKGFDLCLQAELPGLGISLLNSSPEELLYTYLDGISGCIELSDQATSYRLDVKGLQIDNQVLSARYPVVLKPQSKFQPALWFLQVAMVTDQRYPGLTYVDNLSIDIQPMSVMIDATLLPKLTRFAMTALAGERIDVEQQQSGVENLNLEGLEPDGDDMEGNRMMVTQVQGLKMREWNDLKDPQVVEEAQNLDFRGGGEESAKFYFRAIDIAPVYVSLSFCIATPDALVKEQRSPQPMLLMTALMNTFANVENAFLGTKQVQLRHIFSTPTAAAEMIKRRYASDLLGQAYKLIGSADILGNPVGLVNSLAQGLYDFVRMPLAGLAHGDVAELGRGLLFGSSSLLRNTAFAATDAIARFFSGASRGLAALATDDFTGFRAGDGTLNGIVWGALGVFICPTRGAQRNGIGGFARGFLAGIIGLLCKPASGLIWSLSERMAQLRDALTTGDNFKRRLRRVRPPRYFPSGRKVLRHYKKEESEGEELIARVEFGRYRSDGYIRHEIVGKGKGMLLLLTTKRILVVFNDVKRYCVLAWVVKLHDICICTVDVSDILLYHLPVHAPKETTEREREHDFSLDGFKFIERRVECASAKQAQDLLEIIKSMIPAISPPHIEEEEKRRSEFRKWLVKMI
eukprot:g3449.t1